jgi:hypothetical protein
LNPRPLDDFRGIARTTVSGPEATDSLCVVRGSPSLPVSGYPSGAESDGANLDTKWTLFESARR